MRIKPFFGYIGGIALLALVLVAAALLPLVFANNAQGIGDPHLVSETAPPIAAPRPSPMSRNERIELIGIHMDFAANLRALPDWMHLRTLPTSEIEPERRTFLYARYAHLMAVFHLDRRNRTADIGIGIQSDVEPQLGFEVREHGNTFYSFTNENGELMRVWHIYTRLILEWETWVNLYIDVDTGEIYFFYISSICLGNDWRNTDYAFPFGLGNGEIVDIWGNINGLTPRVAAADAPGERYVFYSGAEELAYSLLWTGHGSIKDYDLMITMLQN